MYTLALKDNFEKPTDLTIKFVVCGRKPEHPERTPTCIGDRAHSVHKDPAWDSI